MLELDTGIGTLRQERSRRSPVGVRQPTLRMDRITVGGTLAKQAFVGSLNPLAFHGKTWLMTENPSTTRRWP